MVLGARSNIYRIALAGVLLAALSLSACGRKGPLEAPPHANLTNGAAQDGAAADDGQKSKKPDRKFFLDPLI